MQGAGTTHNTKDPQPKYEAMKTTTLLMAACNAAALLAMTLTASAGKVAEATVPFDQVVSTGRADELGGSCPEIDWPLHLTGTAHFVVLDTVVSGVHHFVVQNGVHGEASDAAGNSYVFAYA